MACKNAPTLVFLSTHSKQDKVGLLRFCFFLRGSAVGDAVLLSRSPADVPRPGLPPAPLGMAALPHNGESGLAASSPRADRRSPRRSVESPASIWRK